MNTINLPDGVTTDSSAQQITNSVTTTLNAADSTSADRVQTLGLVHQARVSRLTRTSVALTAQYGANATQAVNAQLAVTSAQTTVARVQVVHRQATTTEPQVAVAGWVLHGRVYDAQSNPVVGHTVFLVDSQKNYQSAYGFAYTDSTGYFVINYAGNAAGSSEQNTAPAAAAPPNLYVQIANTSAKPVYLSTAAFQPSTGNATYQNITLPAGEPTLGDPPAAIRKVALPPTGKTA
jgi:hypothetical protein